MIIVVVLMSVCTIGGKHQLAGSNMRYYCHYGSSPNHYYNDTLGRNSCTTTTSTSITSIDATTPTTTYQYY